MKKLLYPAISLFIVLYACNPKDNKPKDVPAEDINQGINENSNGELKAETDAFARICAEQGLTKAVQEYASDDAIFLREMSPAVIGKDSIEAVLTRKKKDFTAEMITEKMEVSASNDMGYTFGSLNIVKKSADGQTNQVKGIFNSVWCKNADGKWRFVLLSASVNDIKSEGKKDGSLQK